MKDTFTKFGAVAVALAMSGVPTALVHAQDAATDGVSAEATSVSSGTVAPTTVRDDSATRPADPRVLMEQKRELLKKRAEQVRELKQERRALVASSSEGAPINERAREQLKQKAEQAREESKQQLEQAREMVKDRLELLREGTTTAARSAGQLKEIIEARRMEIKDRLASTSPLGRKAFEHASEVSVAVHALLASKDLLGGGIGSQVSEIAKQMNDSVATTTDVEAKLQSRGILSRILFGGDKKSAGVIAAQIEQNKTRMQTLTGLLSSASTTEEVKATLDAQVQAMQDEQNRLQAVAQGQSKLWGLFSWRLF